MAGHGDRVIPEAWVTYADASYFGVLRVLLRSLEAFSSRPVLVYAVRENLDATGHPNVIDVRRTDDPEHIWTLKLTLMADAASSAKRLIFLDADTVANYSVDDLWQWFAMQQEHPDLPLLPNHTVLTNNAVAVKYEQATGERIDRPFGCTTPIWYTGECVPLLQESADIRRRAEKQWPDVGDGEAVNAALARHGNRRNAPLCTPYYRYADSYLQQTPPPLEAMGEAPELHYHLFHGCKDAKEAGRLLESLSVVRFPTHYERTPR